MATQINGKLYRNVKGASEGIVTDKLTTTGDIALGSESGPAYIRLNNDGFVFGAKSGSVEIAGSASNDKATISADGGVLIQSGDEDITLSASSGEVSVSAGEVSISSGLVTLGNASSTRISVNDDGKLIELGKSEETNLIIDNSDSARINAVSDSIYLQDLADENSIALSNANGVEIYIENGYFKLSGNIPTSDPQEEGAIWNDSGVLKISAGQ